MTVNTSLADLDLVMINIKGIWAALKFFTVLAATLPK
jgi:hypothetical protein